MAPAVRRKRTSLSSSVTRLNADEEVQHGGENAGGAIGRRGDDASARGVFFVHGHRPKAHPIERRRADRAAPPRDARSVRETSLARAAATFRPPGSMPSLRQPRSTHSCMACQTRSRAARVSASGRQAASLRRVISLMLRPDSRAIRSRSSPLRKGKGRVRAGRRSIHRAAAAPSFTTKPPPTLK